MSVIVVILKAFHFRVDDPVCIFLSLIGQMQINHGGFQAGMAEISLNDSEVDSGLEQVGGIGVSQGVNGDGFLFNACGKFGSSKGALDGFHGHGALGGRAILTASAHGGKDKPGISMGDPVSPQ